MSSEFVMLGVPTDSPVAFDAFSAFVLVKVGISSVWFEGNPCNMHLLDLAEEVSAVIYQFGSLSCHSCSPKRDVFLPSHSVSDSRYDQI